MNTSTVGAKRPTWAGQTLKVSLHAVRRARERLHWSKHAIARMADRALTIGLSPEECPGALRLALMSKSSSEGLSRPFLYGEVIYFFSYVPARNEIVLQTVYRAPQALLRVLVNKTHRYAGEIESGDN